VEGVGGDIKSRLTEIAGLDASTIAVESNDKSKTVTLAGSVKSADQRRVVGEIARKHAKGYKIVNRLTVAR
jgi:osmotically-inducible protein OsmY